MRFGIPMIPIPIIKDFDFRNYVGEGTFYVNLEDKYDASAKAHFREWRIQFPEIVRAIRYLFDVIATPFYGHASQAVQGAQVVEITRRMKGMEGMKRLSSKVKGSLVHSNPHVGSLVHSRVDGY